MRLQLVFETLMDIVEQPDIEEDQEDLELDSNTTTQTEPPIFQDPTFSYIL
jgi:hypothetical protein